MIEIQETPQLVIDWCNQHPRCKKCQFAGNQCVIPDGDSRYAGWHQGMVKIIEAQAVA